MAKHCIECGATLREDARFCEECGTNVSELGTENQSREEIEKEIREKIEEEYRQKSLKEFKEEKERELREEMEKKLEEQQNKAGQKEFLERIEREKNEKEEIGKLTEQIAKERIARREYYLSYFKLNLDRKELTQIAIISVCIATALIFITFIVGSIMMGSYDKSQTINIELGFPLPWLRFQTFTYGPPTLEISNWFNSIINFIVYTALVFGLSYQVEVILKNNKNLKQALKSNE